MSFSGKATSIQPVWTCVGPSLSSECAYCYCIPKQTDEALRGPSRPCQHHPGVLPSSRDGINSTWPRFQCASCLLRNEINYTLVVHVCPLCDLTKRVPTCVRLQSNRTLIAPLAIAIVMFTFGSSEGWNTPKYSLNGWLSLKAHHWATVQRFLTTIWFFWCLQCSDFGFLLSVPWLRRRLLVRGGSVLLDQGCQLAMAHSLSALHLHKQR